MYYYVLNILKLLVRNLALNYSISYEEALSKQLLVLVYKYFKLFDINNQIAKYYQPILRTYKQNYLKMKITIPCFDNIINNSILKLI